MKKFLFFPVLSLSFYLFFEEGVKVAYEILVNYAKVSYEKQDVGY